MNFYKEDLNLQMILSKYFKEDFFVWASKELEEFGELCANEIDQRAIHTDREGQPRLIKYDAYGNDISHVWVNEGYKQTVKDTYNRGIVSYLHKPIPELGIKGNYIYSYAQGYLLSQTEAGFYCPVTLSMAATFLVERYADEALKEKYLPHLLSTGETELYEGATFLTERQGGSDVGANVVKAIKEGDYYRIYGEKYFASNAGQCGITTILARIEGAPSGSKGLSLFLVPWKNDDGTNNGFTIRRLKDKLGVRAVPSGEIEFNGAKAFLIGDASKGINYMMEALNLSRICNAVASIGIMRRAFLEAKKYAENRPAFGQLLTNFPMIQETLAKLASIQEVQTSAVFNLVALYDRVIGKENGTNEEQALVRLLIAILKMRTAEEAIHFSHEAIEMHGGNGYIEDFVTPRLLRDAQVLTVWEGTANILGLEILRLFKKMNVYPIFKAFIEEKLIDVPQSLDDESIIVKKKLEELNEVVNYVHTLDANSQTYYAKKIANKMADLVEAVTAIEDAKDHIRKEYIAKVMIHERYFKDEINKEQIHLKYYDEIVNYKVSINK
ncbi:MULTISPECIES: acyl-CoA dehydrogenase family protein [unclassified Bacillus (in: firmicutes)]|uniref:acyl-CoA dehydrogenase family protein n=1 Tax=unclassified Bacillus (in: firmicutes) TaxID=185979 RepID=UPI000BF11EDA|nr:MULTISPECIES: acyl-CoA dehydrogenase family protein [unclassified Bacillus (in: firmicutes)]PEJ56797.1 isovaleryl-CoA dehydrogenase [Bacillus sp. AFS002410]PEL13920.1 isovaleryl-CoA dehydrogenase [Bacillus sp. AFS017336]